MTRLGDDKWDVARRAHFTVLRELLAVHGGTEVKNTGDGLMASFPSAVDAAACAIVMQQRVEREAEVGSPIQVRIGLSTGEAASEGGDWFGTPVVEAARLCALAGPGESWATSIVRVLVGSAGRATFRDIGPKVLKGFEQPVDVVAIEAGVGPDWSYYASVDDHHEASDALVAQLDYWESLPSIQEVRSTAVTALSPVAGDRICDIGCATGTQLARLARIIGAEGRAVGVDPSQLMCDETRRRATAAGVDVEVVCADGRETGLPGGSFDAVHIDRVIQHTGDAAAFVREALRLVRPGGRVVLVDSDWGSLMIHPGDRPLIERIKGGFTSGPLRQPWAGRTLHGALVDAGFVEVASRVHAVSAAGPGVATFIEAFKARRVATGIATEAELDAFGADHAAAMERGDGVFAFCMFVAWGRRPTEP